VIYRRFSLSGGLQLNITVICAGSGYVMFFFLTILMESGEKKLLWPNNFQEGAVPLKLGKHL
jgi:hypothetical protein